MEDEQTKRDLDLFEKLINLMKKEKAAVKAVINNSDWDDSKEFHENLEVFINKIKQESKSNKKIRKMK